MLLSDLAQAIGAELDGDPSADVSACATLDEAIPGQVTFLASPKYADRIGSTRATAIVVAPGTPRPDSGVSLLKAKDPYFAFRNAVVALHGFRQHPTWEAAAGSTKPESRIPKQTEENPKSKTPSSHLTSDITHLTSLISPLSAIHPSAEIGEGTVIYPFVFVGPNVKIGRDCILYPSVTVYDGCILGDRVILHAGTSVGHDGFGYATHALPGQPPAHHKIPQSGIAILEDDVELGANCSVDRATVGATTIGRGTKFSNNVVIGHGAKIGPHNLFVGQVGIAGSVTTGAYVVMGGQVGVAGHLKIGNQVQLAAQTGVIADIPDKSIEMGTPSMPIMQARRVWSHTTNLDELVKRIRELEKKVAELSPPQ
jgi:UDP-3-O-[3-hydroxymyristoyl] glucosamine N-acyltransferase